VFNGFAVTLQNAQKKKNSQMRRFHSSFLNLLSNPIFASVSLKWKFLHKNFVLVTACPVYHNLLNFGSLKVFSAPLSYRKHTT